MHVYNSHRGQLGLHLPDKLLVDNFAGGGGASIAMEMAFGRPVDIAINHDPEAISMHKVNHPDTEHYCESVWDVDPVKACAGREVEWAHFSPDCTHHSKARGGKPKQKEIRGLAWIVIKWAILKEPITTNDRFGLVTVHGVDYQIVDIGMRMLEPHELYAAQSFPPGYIHDRTADGKKLSKKAQVRMCGNSVAPEPFAALIRANINKEAKEQEQAA